MLAMPQGESAAEPQPIKDDSPQRHRDHREKPAILTGLTILFAKQDFEVESYREETRKIGPCISL